MKKYTKPTLTKHATLCQITFSVDKTKTVSPRMQDDIHKLTEYYRSKEGK